MNKHLACAAGLVAIVGFAPLSSATSLDSMKDKAGSLLSGQSDSSSGSLLSSLSSGSFDLGSMSNVAGVLGYCQEQGYSKSATQTVKEKLLGKLGGQQEASRDKSYQEGLSGILQGQEEGKSFNLGGIKDQVGEKVCGAIADKAMSSFLGG
ncbi:Protein of unknown function [Modicisalibacter ilicicola DSM 19980]|uniref:DUF2501 domain-containing protein n=1 Tax=Modicisalibacter ilicicola DSM 19980 TaxID=1121942 RepID=A0A1M5E1H1_9GAMM|nr:DUF2501 domain-containing protein [Halomonas ilicicola]SHF73118.1 Protein of unknown function [Halomonas ilicicola DSM 19980]